jgi:DNA polymerase-3 subunit epsilon
MARQIVLDTETTGLNPLQGDRLIEIGCVELFDRKKTGKTFHYYINPQRDVPEESTKIHGITSDFLQDKPLFIDIVDDLLAFINGAELVIHNAAFDLSFLNYELKLLPKTYPLIQESCTILDTLLLAKDRHPGQRNTLDALVDRYAVSQRDRTYHGALLDSEILADVYLAMTGGQVGLALGGEEMDAQGSARWDMSKRIISAHSLPVIMPSAEELAEHQGLLELIDKASAGQCIWRTLAVNSST